MDCGHDPGLDSTDPANQDRLTGASCPSSPPGWGGLVGRTATANRPCHRRGRLACGVTLWGVGCVLFAILLGACSRGLEPLAGFGGLDFGAARPGDCAAVAVPLPSALADSLAYCACPGRGGEFQGATLAEPVFGFYQGRFFAASATLAAPQQAEILRRGLTRSYGPPYCRDGPKLAVCLWRAGETDVVLETPAQGPPRLLVRSRTLAGQVARAAGMSGAPAGDPVEAGDEPAPSP